MFAGCRASIFSSFLMLSLSRLKGHWLTALSRYIWDKDDEADEPLFQELPNAVSLYSVIGELGPLCLV